MAHWLGQFSGVTHATRVEEIERLARNAVATLRACPADEKSAKAKALEKTAEALDKRAKQTDRLRGELEATTRVGTAAILRELGAADAIDE